MHIDFSLLPDHARLWVYQGDRKFTASEQKIIEQEARAFCNQWVAHGTPLKTSFRIERAQFLILAVDEDFNGASGCSIDGSVHMLKSLQDRTGIDFFDRSKIAFLIKDEVNLIPLTELKKAFAAGTLGSTTLSFNVLVTSKGEWEKNWLVAVEKTWLGKYLPKITAAQ